MNEKIALSQKTSQPNRGSKILISGTKKQELGQAVEKYALEALRKLQKHTNKNLKLNEIVFCHRMTSTLGLSQFQYLGRNFYYTIKISSKIFTKDCRSLKETVYHEVAHVVDHQIYRGWGHGKTWVRLMERLGLPPTVFATDEDYKDAGYKRKNPQP